MSWPDIIWVKPIIWSSKWIDFSTVSCGHIIPPSHWTKNEVFHIWLHLLKKSLMEKFIFVQCLFPALALKSHIKRSNNEFLAITPNGICSNSSKKLSNSSFIWLGDLYNEAIQPFLFRVQTSKIMQSLQNNAVSHKQATAYPYHLKTLTIGNYFTRTNYFISILKYV